MIIYKELRRRHGSLSATRHRVQTLCLDDDPPRRSHHPIPDYRIRTKQVTRQTFLRRPRLSKSPLSN